MLLVGVKREGWNMGVSHFLDEERKGRGKKNGWVIPPQTRKYLSLQIRRKMEKKTYAKDAIITSPICTHPSWIELVIHSHCHSHFAVRRFHKRSIFMVFWPNHIVVKMLRENLGFCLHSY